MADLPKAGVQLVAEDASAFDRALASASKSVTGLEQSLTAAGPAASKFGSVMTGALERVGHLAVDALGSAARALGSFIATSVEGAGDYEQSMNVLQSTTGATDETMQAVKETAKALGADLSLPATSAASAGDAMLYLAQQGLSVDDAMAAAKGTLQLAAAGMVDEKTAAETTATALNQFGLAGAEATRIADLLAASVSASGSGVAQTGQAVQQAGTAFASAHVPIEDFVTLINEMSKAGIKGSDAGTSLKTMMQRLEAPTAKAAVAMDELGVSVYDSQGAMRPMREIIGQFSTSLQGLTQEQRDQAIVTIFGSDAQRAANIVLAGGTDAYDAMYKAVTKSGAASDLAGARMKGLKGTIAGLQSQLETLALEAIEPLLPMMTAMVMRGAEIAGSFVGKVGPGIKTAVDLIIAIADVISTGAVPALYALTAATVIYALTNLPAMIGALGTATAAIAANGAAMLLAAGPFVVIAGAIAMVAIKYKQLDDQLASVADRVLEGNKAYQDSVSALAGYDQASDEVKTGAHDQAEALRDLQDAQREALKNYTLHLAAYEQFGVASGQTASSLQAERDAINERTTAIQTGTSALDSQVATYEHLHDTDAIEEIRLLRGAHQELAEAVQMDAAAYEELAKAADKAAKEGAAAVESYVSSAIKFYDDLTKAITSGSDEQTRTVAANYVEQVAASRAAIGKQLADWTVAYAAMNHVSDETLNAVLGQIEKTFGVTSDLGARTMNDLQVDIKKAMASGGTAVDGLGEQLGSTTEKAVTMRQRMLELQGKYETELIHNFDPSKQKVEDLIHDLLAVPRRVEIEVHTTYSSTGTNRPETGTSGLATGGPADAGQMYRIGEQGPELFAPAQNGYIFPRDQAMRIAQTASPAQIAATPRAATGPTYNGQVGNTYNYAPTYAQTPRAPMTDFLAMRAFNL